MLILVTLNKNWILFIFILRKPTNTRGLKYAGLYHISGAGSGSHISSHTSTILPIGCLYAYLFWHLCENEIQGGGGGGGGGVLIGYMKTMWKEKLQSKTA